MDILSKYEAIVIGTSAGGLYALKAILEKLPADFPLPVITVQHRAKNERDLLEEILQNSCYLRIKQADEKERIEPGTVYFAPADYHLLIEKDRTFSLSVEEHNNYSRPSIDILFETAAEAYREKLIGIILTGANHDGANGIKKISEYEGLTIAQNPATAQYPVMPQAAVNTKKIKYILELDTIAGFLLN